MSVSVPYEITLLSNFIKTALNTCVVSVPYEITLLSNGVSIPLTGTTVSVPYEITLLSNSCYYNTRIEEFQYLMKLHYSQTLIWWVANFFLFQYLMKLHYSQTGGSI